MSALFLIGNGFDLAHGLKTSYKDFILWYLNRSLLNCRGSFEDDLIQIRGYRGGAAPIDSIRDYHQFISANSIKINYKYSFLTRLMSNSSQTNWVDIESEYYRRLVELYRYLEKAGTDKHARVDAEIKSLNDCFEHIKSKLVEYLLEFESVPKVKNSEIEQHISSVINAVAHRNSFNLSSEKVLVLNFNYTSTFEPYAPKEFPHNLFAINYIHGRLRDVKNPIIFGYGDEVDHYYEKIERLNDNNFFRNIKSFGYLKTHNYQNLMRFIDEANSGFEVHIMGHSCGLSDRVLLNSIFEHPNCTSIRIYFHQKDDVIDDYFEKTQEISRHFKAAGKVNMRKIIVPHSQSRPLLRFKDKH